MLEKFWSLLRWIISGERYQFIAIHPMRLEWVYRDMVTGKYYLVPYLLPVHDNYSDRQVISESYIVDHKEPGWMRAYVEHSMSLYPMIDDVAQCANRQLAQSTRFLKERSPGRMTQFPGEPDPIP